MEQFLRFLQGYVHIRLISKTPERFLKLCAHHGISLRHVVHRDGFYEMELDLRDFRRLREICRKSSSRIHILQKTGMPFFFYKNKKRKAFFVGIFCCLLLLFLCSTRIWNIHVEGNYSYSVQTVLGYLEEEHIVHGIAKRQVNCSQIAAALREHFPEITWVSAKIQGTRLMITIQENMDTPEEIADDEEEPCNLVADCDGVIVHMITRRGVPQMTEGQICQKGDVLISGRLEILNDNQEVARYEYVPSDGDIYVQRDYSYYDEFSMEYQKRMYTGRNKKSFCIQVNQMRLCLGIPFGNYERYDQVNSLHRAQLTENFILPLWVGISDDREYVIRKLRYTEKEAALLAENHLVKFMEDLTEKGVKISRNNVTIAVNDNSCVAKGTITVVEQTGKKGPLEKMADPREGITTDEQ